MFVPLQFSNQASDPNSYVDTDVRVSVGLATVDDFIERWENLFNKAAAIR